MAEAATERPQEYRVNHPMYRSYNDFLHEFKLSFLPDVKRLFVQDTKFKNQAPWLKVFKGLRGVRSEIVPNNDIAYVPVWIEPNQFNVGLETTEHGVGQLFNSLLHTEEGRPSLVKRIVAVAPYIEARQDKDGPGVDHEVTIIEDHSPYMEASLEPSVAIQRDKDAGEAIEAEMIGREFASQGLNGQKLVWLSPHSYEAYDAMCHPKIPIPGKNPIELNIDVLPISTAPLVARELQSHNVVSNNTVVVALDKGSLQQCLHLTDLLGLSYENNLVVFDKKRKEHNQVADLSMIFGTPDKLKGKDIIIYDDIIDTFGSMKKTCEALKKLGCRSITVAASHGVLSHPARDNIIQSLDTNIVDRVILTDSLPNAPDYFEDLGERVHILPVAKLLGVFAQLFGVSSGQEMRENPLFRDYIIDPKPKEQVWVEFVQAMEKAKAQN